MGHRQPRGKNIRPCRARQNQLTQIKKSIMDPITASTTFATIVGLVCNFRSERGDREALSHREFIEWLEYHRHEQIKEIICNTLHLQTEVDQLLRANHAEILQAVNRANVLLTDVLARLDAFAPLANRIAPARNVSDQAISILKQLRDSGAPEVAMLKYIGGFQLSPFGYGNTGGAMELSDPLFAEDDLNTLVEAGLLRPRMSSRGDMFYGITRAAVQLLDTIKK
jgi:hypothetical protein